MPSVRLLDVPGLAPTAPYAYAATTDPGDLHTAWDVVHARFADHPVPSTLAGVTVLGYPDQLVEIEAWAVVAPR